MENGQISGISSTRPRTFRWHLSLHVKQIHSVITAHAPAAGVLLHTNIGYTTLVARHRVRLTFPCNYGILLVPVEDAAPSCPTPLVFAFWIQTTEIFPTPVVIIISYSGTFALLTTFRANGIMWLRHGRTRNIILPFATFNHRFTSTISFTGTHLDSLVLHPNLRDIETQPRPFPSTFAITGSLYSDIFTMISSPRFNSHSVILLPFF